MSGKCDPPYYRLPGCNDAGYFYRGTPPAGAGKGFNRLEDFAESVTAYVYPDEARQKVARYAGTEYEDLLYYEDYIQTPRWRFVHNLINASGADDE